MRKRIALGVALASGLLTGVRPLAGSPPGTVPDGAAQPTGGEVKEPNRSRIGAEAALLAPQGEWAEIAGTGLGVMGRLDFMVAPSLAIATRLGAIFHGTKESGDGVYAMSSSSRELLLVAGPRLYLAPELSLNAETGLVQMQASGTGYDASYSINETRIPFIAAASYTMDRGFTASAGVFFPNVLLREDDEDVQLGLILNLGYTTPM